MDISYRLLQAGLSLTDYLATVSLKEAAEFVEKNPALDDGFHPALLERADELETHPLA